MAKRVTKDQARRFDVFAGRERQQFRLAMKGKPSRWPSRKPYQKLWWHETPERLAWLNAPESGFKFLSFSALKKAVKKAGVNSPITYGRIQKKYPEWPSMPNQSYAGWVSWPNFFGREKKFLTLPELRKAVQKEGINKHTEYLAARKKHKCRWPSTPPMFYREEWVSWLDLFGRPPLLGLVELKKAVKKAGVTTEAEYKLAKIDRLEWPHSPAQVHPKDWISWPAFFDRAPRSGALTREGLAKSQKRTRHLLTLPQLRKAVKRAKVKGQKHYQSEQKKHADWPSAPNASYFRAGWVSWGDLFGKPPFFSFSRLKKAARKAKIGSSDEYSVEQKKHHEWPASPQITFMNKWQGWPEFLGTTRKQFLTLEELRKEVAEIRGISSRKSYQAERHKHPGWPCNPDTTYRTQWVSWPNFFGR